MGLWSSLVEGVRSSLVEGVAAVGAAIVKTARSVRNAVSAGLAAVGAVAQRVVRTVEAGWNYVKTGVARARDVIVKAARYVADTAHDFYRDVQHKMREELGEAQPRAARKHHNEAAANAVAQAQTELATHLEKERIERERIEAERRLAEETEAETLRQRSLDETVRLEFVSFAEGLNEDLNALLARSSIDDFSAFLRVRTCATLAAALAADAIDVDSFRASIDPFVLECLHSLKRLAAGTDLIHTEWAALDHLSTHRLGAGLIERSGEQLFAMWIGERLEVEARLEGIAREISEAERDIRYARIRLASMKTLTPEEEFKRLSAEERKKRLESEQRARRERRDELILFSGVSEGLLLVLTGEEADDFAAEELGEAGRIMTLWAKCGSVSMEQREVMESLALVYRARATERAQRVIQTGEITIAN
jgi:hypothetical protein